MEARHIRLALLALSLLAVAMTAGGCSGCESKPKPDAGPAVVCGDTEKLSDDGTKCCAKQCVYGYNADNCTCKAPCTYDAACGDGNRCDIPTGFCVKAVRCQNATAGVESVQGSKSCSPLDGGAEHAYCKDADGQPCRCVPLATPEGTSDGYCIRRTPPCAPCTADAECGTDENLFDSDIHNPAKCVSLPGHADQKICLETFSQTECSGTCGAALKIGADDMCAPQVLGYEACLTGGSFSCCDEDYSEGADPSKREICPKAAPLCYRKDGVCAPPCKVESFTVQPRKYTNCPAGKVCHVMAKYLDETDPLYGSGRCGDACPSDAACEAGTFCVEESPGQASTARCRLKGCMDNAECGSTERPEYVTFCDLSKNKCICDDSVVGGECYCRGTNPATGDIWQGPQGYYNACNLENGDGTPRYPGENNALCDCQTGFKCSLDPRTQNRCVEKDCIDEGGQHNACGPLAMCCGYDGESPENEEFNKTRAECSRTIAMADTDKAALGECYRPPTALWCKNCASHGDCRLPMGDVMPPSDPKTDNPSKDRPVCDATNTCLFPCKAESDCPSQFACREVIVSCLRPGDNPNVMTAPTPDSCGQHPERCDADCQFVQQGETVGHVCKCSCTTPYAEEQCQGIQPQARCSKTGDVCVIGEFCEQRNYGIPSNPVCQVPDLPDP